MVSHYKIFQLKPLESIDNVRFLSLNLLKKIKPDISLNDYETVYENDYATDANNDIEMLNALFEKFNVDKPADFKGHSMSASDIIDLNGQLYYVNTFGFAQIDNHFERKTQDGILYHKRQKENCSNNP